MKKLIFLIVLLTTATSASAADTAPVTPPPASPADVAYAHLKQVRYARIPRMTDVKASSALQMKQHDESSRLAEKFLDQFPDDPRKWEVVACAVNSPRIYAPGDPDEARWAIRRDKLRDALLAAPGVVPTTWDFTAERYADDLDGFRDTPVRDLAKARKIIDLMAVHSPQSSRRVFTEQPYLDALQTSDAPAAEAFLRLRASPAETNMPVKDMAEGRLRIIEGAKKPMELAFVAADGRKVDLAQLRGKVVLIDFWATWCVPCMQEMPNVKAVYQKYHDKGFEIVGISFEKAPAGTPNRMEKTAEQLVEFTQKHDMPWPQYFDGKYWSNDIGKRFSIASIPAAFLLAKNGRIVTTETHGEKLGPEVEQLLKD